MGSHLKAKMMYYHIYLCLGNKYNHYCVITQTLQNGQTLGQFFELLYKQLPSNTKIGDPTKIDRYCEVCQGYLPFSILVWWYVILIVIIEILKILKLYIPLSESPHFPDDLLYMPLSLPCPILHSSYLNLFHYGLNTPLIICLLLNIS